MKITNYPDDVTLYISEDRGVYIPKVFAEVITSENIKPNENEKIVDMVLDTYDY